MTKQVLPGATLGVLGGGQLGRMFCVAARTMGYRTVVLMVLFYQPGREEAYAWMEDLVFDDLAAVVH